MIGAMEPDADYLTSFGPFLRLLNSSDELEMLAARPGYSKDIGRSYRDLRRRTMRGYLLDLEAEFEALYRQASTTAVHDPALAGLLAGMDAGIREVGRQVRFRLWLEGVLPVPRGRGRKGWLNQIARLLVADGRQSSGLLTSMNRLRAALSTPLP
jgi:hypothetical protein